MRPPAWSVVGAAVAGGALALLPGMVLAHGGDDVSGRLPTALGEWSFDSASIVAVAALVGLYGWGYRRLRGQRRDVGGHFSFPVWRAIAFGAGALLLLVALISPIDSYGDDLFWAHMLQHILLVMLVVPLLLLGAPATLALRVASPRVRRWYLVPFLNSRLVRFVSQPLVALLLFVASLWIWHLPVAYEAAVRHDAVHILEHGSFLGGALVFWWAIIGVDASRLRPGYLARVVLLIAATLQNTALAMILSSSETPLYDRYAAVVRDWGPSAIIDQRIGVGIMWVPGAMMFLLAILATVYAWAVHEGFQGRQDDLLRDLAKRPAAGRHPPGGALDRPERAGEAEARPREGAGQER